MHAAPPRTPTRGNWIWLGSALVAAAAALTAILVIPVAHSCPPLPGQSPARGGSALARAPLTARLDSALVAGRVPDAGPARPSPTGTGTAAPRPSPTATAGTAAPSAGTAPADAVHGTAVSYYPGASLGDCTLGPLRRGGSYVRLPPRRFHGGAACGSYLDVRGPRGSVRAEVVDLCLTCAARTVDLSRAAFHHVADTQPGSATVSFWAATDPPLPGPLKLRVALASGHRAVQVINNGNRLRSVAVRPGTPAATWRTLTPGPNGFWVGSQHLGTGPFTVVVTDVLGHRAVLSGVKLAPQTLVTSSVWMYHPAPPHHTPRRPHHHHPRTPAAGLLTPPPGEPTVACRELAAT